jgi:hypothetical protein
MCPLCIGTTLALIAAGAGSAGGLAALIVKKVSGSGIPPLEGGQNDDDSQDRNS